MRPCFKKMKRNLAYCRINHIIDLHRQQRNFLIVGLRIVEHRLEHQHFAEHRRHLFGRHSRRLVQDTVLPPQLVVAPVTKLMCQSQYVIALAGKIQQQKRMLLGQRSRTKSSAALAVFRRHINPRFIKKLTRNRMQFRRKGMVRFQNRLNGFFPRIFLVIFKRQRRISVPIFDFLHTEQFRLYLVKAPGDVFIIVPHRLRQIFHRFVADFFRQIA